MPKPTVITTLGILLGLLWSAAVPAAGDGRDARAPGVEKWADPKLPVTNGLELWLDAQRPEATVDANAKTPANGVSVAVWYDASGNNRLLQQATTALQPVYRTDLCKGLTVLRFDGVDDRLTATGLGLDLRECTVFVVAAPFSNSGNFRAFLSFNEKGKNDYITGLNLDMGGAGGGRFERLNIEGRGAGGERNLLNDASDFGVFRIMTLTSTVGQEGVQLYLDGKKQGERARTAGVLRMDQIRLGARHYSNTAAPTLDGGFLDGCIAEVLIYSRVLTADERASVEKYLREKHDALLKLKGLPPEPVVRFLVPGFTVRELPVKLSNLTGVMYAPDGRLFALGYDGRIHVLKDTDGDGLEDRAESFWDQPTLRTPTAMAWRPEGLYVVSNSKVSLLRDTDGDGKADQEEIVVQGWAKDDGKTGGNVDAVGLALDKDGNLYFGLGCADYSNAYRIKDGKAHYDIKSERGTIIKVSADRKNREILCTGIRFPYGLAFNRDGDLFCTDQEGETWLPNGNPLDELNHIIPGRHYGFPPRHEVHLPNVIDEPPVIGFGPQHQSACGLLFNEAKPGQKPFGPAFWEGDALVCGFSRGKLWRVRLVKTPSGYVGKPTLIATSRMMLLDTALSPSGELVLNCHSGPPDWGTGPGGPGKLFKVTYSDRKAPQPRAVWAAGPMEVRLAFDRWFEEAWLDLTKATIVFGEHVRAADRFEVLRPPYKSVENQLQAFRGKLGVATTRWFFDDCITYIVTDPHPMKATYALTLPLGARGAQQTAFDLAYDLAGVEWTWKGPLKGSESSGWLPSMDLDVARALTAGFTVPGQEPGFLQLRTRLEPKTTSPVTLQLDANAEFVLEGGGKEVRSTKAKNGRHQAELTVPQDKPVQVAVKSHSGEVKVLQLPRLQLHASYHTASDPTPRPLPLDWQMLPWAPSTLPPAPPPKELPAELAGGDWKRGEAVFLSKEANCAACHTLRGQGGKIAPDLSNLTHRDAPSVLRDIIEPSVAINPDYVSHIISLRDGRLLTGIVRAAGEEKVRVFDSEAKETVVSRDDVEQLKASPLSVMPQNYAEVLGKEKLRDLVTFLTNPPPKPSPLRGRGQGEGSAPPPRSRAEVEAVLRASTNPASEKPRSLNIVLVAGPKDHGPGEHDYPEWQRRWKELLAKAPEVRISTAFRWPDRGHWELADVMIFYYWNHDWTEERYKDLDAFLARGSGVVFLHSAVIEDKEPEKLAQRLGLAAHPKIKYRHGPLDLKIAAPAKHPITQNLKQIHFVDESYWPLIGEESRVQVLATTEEEGKPRPMVWTFEPTEEDGKPGGRVFCSILGHYSWTFDDPFFRILVLRGLAWAAREPVERFHPLVTDGLQLQ